MSKVGMTYSNEIFHSCLGAFKQPPKGRNKHVNWLAFGGKGCRRMFRENSFTPTLLDVLKILKECWFLYYNVSAYNFQPLSCGHLISCLVTRTEHQRPPSSLNTPSKLTLQQGQTFHKHQYSLLWDRQRNQNTSWPSTGDLYSCIFHVLLPAAEGKALTWVEDFQRLSCLAK